MKTSTSQDKNKLLHITVAAVFWISVWYAAAYFVKSELLLPYPHDVIRSLLTLMATGEFYLSVLFSVLRILGGFLIGIIAGLFCGIVSSVSKLSDVLISPMMTVIRSTPVASFIILTLVWFENTAVPIFISFLMVTPIIYAQTMLGINKCDKDILEMTHAYGFTFKRSLVHFWIPSVKPYFISGLLTSMGLAWKAGIAAEVLCSPSPSIGKDLYEAKKYLETPDMLAWTLTVIIMSMLLERLIKKYLTGSKGVNKNL